MGYINMNGRIYDPLLGEGFPSLSYFGSICYHIISYTAEFLRLSHCWAKVFLRSFILVAFATITPLSRLFSYYLLLTAQDVRSLPKRIFRSSWTKVFLRSTILVASATIS
ncbi:MAG: hypothetical protein HC905_26750 [Bacteroidales bacterium]|nr:hypothetical protein [Bacteroidales bacterium]